MHCRHVRPRRLFLPNQVYYDAENWRPHESRRMVFVLQWEYPRWGTCPNLQNRTEVRQKRSAPCKSPPAGSLRALPEGAPDGEFARSNSDVSSDCGSVVSTASLEEKAQYSEDEPADDLNFWLSPQNDHRGKDGDVTTNDEALTHTIRHPLMQDQRLKISSLISPVVDVRRYSLSVNTITSVVTVVWKLSDRADRWEGFCEAKWKVLSRGHKALRACCNSSLSIHTYEECVARAQRWCCWHAAWVYSERPTTRLLGLPGTRPASY